MTGDAPMLARLFHMHETVDRRRLDALLAAGEYVRDGGACRSEVHDFVRRYAIPHMKEEERALFPAALRAGVPAAHIASLRRDHGSLAAISRKVERAFGRGRTGSPRHAALVLVRFAELFHLHAAREEAIFTETPTAGSRAPASEIPRHYEFESLGETVLDEMPIDLRRKLAHAGVDLTQLVWRAIPRSERARLTAHPLSDDRDAARLARATFAAVREAGGEATASPPIGVASPPWSTPQALDRVRAASKPLGRNVEDAAWLGLEDGERYALDRIAQGPEAQVPLGDALTELGAATFA